MTQAKTHVIVESLKACDLARSELGEGGFVWWTTSPAVLSELTLRGEDVRSPEGLLQPDEADNIAHLAAAVSKNICEKIVSENGWPEWVDIAVLFDLQMFRCISVSLYKARQIDIVVQQAAGAPVYCVGDPQRSAANSGVMIYDRLETLFAQILSYEEFSNVGLIEQKLSAQDRRKIEGVVYQGPTLFFEKILSLLTNTPGSVAYKIWRKASRLPLFRRYGITLWPFPQKTVHILKDSELIEEAFPGLLVRGARIRRVPDLPQFEPVTITGTVADDELLEGLDQGSLLDKHHLVPGPWLPAGLSHAIPRVRSVTDHVAASLDRWQQQAEPLLSRMSQRDEILTSSLNATNQRLFAFLCKRKNIRVNTVDHGVTLGLSQAGLFHAGYSGMGLGDRGFYHCTRASRLMRETWHQQRTFAVGLPKQMSGTLFQPWKRRLARKFLNITAGQNVVMIVGDLPKNNFVYGPYLENDIRYYEKTKSIISKVCSDFPDSLIIFKSYPSERYQDHYEFNEMKKKYSNLRILSGAELRFVRHAADLLITTSTQSTLGWVSTSGVPYFYVDFQWSKGLINGLKLEFLKGPMRSSMIFPDNRQVCSPEQLNLSSLIMNEA